MKITPHLDTSSGFSDPGHGSKGDVALASGDISDLRDSGKGKRIENLDTSSGSRNIGHVSEDDIALATCNKRQEARALPGG